MRNTIALPTAKYDLAEDLKRAGDTRGRPARPTIVFQPASPASQRFYFLADVLVSSFSQ